MKIWLDDERIAPPGFLWVKTAQEAISFLKTGQVQLISLDHDLGNELAGTGYDVALFLEKSAYHNEIPPVKWEIHSANPVGRSNMLAALKKADSFWHPQ